MKNIDKEKSFVIKSFLEEYSGFDKKIARLVTFGASADDIKERFGYSAKERGILICRRFQWYMHKNGFNGVKLLQ